MEIKAPALVSRNTEERMFVVDSGASMYMLSKKDLSSGEVDTLRRSRNPPTVVTAIGVVQTNEEAQVYVHDLDLFVTGKLCSGHGYSYEWKNVETPRLTRNGKTIACTMDNFVPLVVPGLSSSPSSSSASTSKPADQSSSSGEPGKSSDPVTTRSDKPACGEPMQTDLDKPTSGNLGSASKKDEMDKIDPTQGIPEWLQPFTDNLEDLETHVPAHSCEETTQIRKVVLQKW